MNKKNVVVTGGAGYIGSHTCKYLASNGFNPIVLDNLSTGHREFVKWGPLVQVNLQDTAELINALIKFKPYAVIHFAGSSYVGESMKDPHKYYSNNVLGTISLLDAMSKSNVKRIVFSSSCATYGIPKQGLIDESTPQYPINPYGHSKLIIENILNSLANMGQISQVSLRYFNAAGADMEGEIGEFHAPETHLIPLAINSSMGGEILKVYGTYFDTPDNTAVRDYVHVEDLAIAHLMALNLLGGQDINEFFNIGTGTGVSVFEVLKRLQRFGVDVRYTNAPRREGDPASLVALFDKANRILGWAPQKSFDDILLSAICWHQRMRQQRIGS